MPRLTHPLEQHKRSLGGKEVFRTLHLKVITKTSGGVPFKNSEGVEIQELN